MRTSIIEIRRQLITITVTLLLLKEYVENMLTETQKMKQNLDKLEDANDNIDS